MSIGKRINLLRKQLNLKQNDFANELGIDQGYVSQLENDKYSASLTLLKLISVLFRINLDWLREGVGEMFITDSNIEQSPLKREVMSKISELNEEQLSRIAGYIDSMQLIVKSGKKIRGGVLAFNIRTSVYKGVFINTI